MNAQPSPEARIEGRASRERRRTSQKDLLAIFSSILCNPHIPLSKFIDEYGLPKIDEALRCGIDRQEREKAILRNFVPAESLHETRCMIRRLDA